MLLLPTRSVCLLIQAGTDTVMKLWCYTESRHMNTEFLFQQENMNTKSWFPIQMTNNTNQYHLLETWNESILQAEQQWAYCIKMM